MRSVASIFVIVVLSALTGGRAAAPAWGALLSVFVRPGLTDAERGDVERTLRATAGVRGVEHESKEQAYARFREQFRDAPDLVAATQPETLPESFRVSVADGTCAEAYLAAFGNAPGVRDVVSVPVAVQPLPRAIGYAVQLGEPTEDVRLAVERVIAGLPGASPPVFEPASEAVERLARCGVPFDPAAALPSVRFAWNLRPGSMAHRDPPMFDRIKGVERAVMLPVEGL